MLITSSKVILLLTKTLMNEIEKQIYRLNQNTTLFMIQRMMRIDIEIEISSFRK